jgi:hypothetical protein
MTVPDINQEDIKEFSSKLEQFAEGLSPQQQALLGMLLVRAVQGDAEDVEAHAWWADPSVHYQIMHMTQIEWSILQHHLSPIIQHAAALHHAVAQAHWEARPQ